MADRRIVVYGCESSGYPAAASALAERADAAELRVELIRLPCSGRIEVGLLLAALEGGAEAVLVLGCPTDACKYVAGNLRAEKRVARARRALRDAGIPEERVRIELVSSLDAHRVAAALAEQGGAHVAPAAAGGGGGDPA